MIDLDDEPIGCLSCGAIAGCCDKYPNCPGNLTWVAPIENDEQHAAYMAEVAKLMESDPELGSAPGDRLSNLATAIDVYEKKRWPL